MSAPSIVIVPQNALATNKMIQDLMTVSGDKHKEEMEHFLTTENNVQNEIMATVLRGVIVKASA